MTLDEFTRKAIGVPWLRYGRDFDAWDCWGLVIAGYRSVKAQELPDFTYTSKVAARDLLRMFDTRTSDPWTPVATPEPMDIACIYRHGRVLHCGLVIPGRRILHIEDDALTVAEPVKAIGRIEGYYRPVTQ